MSELRITVPLSREEFVALRQSASDELRNPRDQARHILRLALLNSSTGPAHKENGGAKVEARTAVPATVI